MVGLLVAASGFKVNSLDRARVPCLLYQLLTLGICNNQDQREREVRFNVEWFKYAMKTQHFHYYTSCTGYSKRADVSLTAFNLSSSD